MLSANLQQPGDTERALKTLQDASTAGYNGVIYRDPTLEAFAKVPAPYAAALNQVTAAARRLNIEFIPSIANVGFGRDLLKLDPSLVESMPCRHVHFVVTGGKLRPSDPPPPIAGGGFDTIAGDLPTGFKAAAHPGVAAFLDPAMKHGGPASLRVEGQPAMAAGSKVVYEQAITVQPWHQYRLSIWTKTAAAQGAAITLTPLGANNQVLGYFDWQNTPEWGRNVLVFNSQENTTVNLQLGVLPIANAKLWIDDLTLEDAGVLNITRRDDCPLSIRGDDGAIFNEFVDVDDVNDTFIPPGSTTPGFDVFHDPKPPSVLGNSKLREGQIVVMDYYAAALIHNNPTFCFSEPKAKSLLKTEIRRVIALTHAKTLHLNLDNVQALGWDPGCEATQTTPGQMLGRLVRDEYNFAKTIVPGVQIVTNSNMFDPNANSKDSYYFMQGGTSDSLRDVPKQTLILNDNSANGLPSSGYFARQGYSQILVGTTDAGSTMAPIDKWIKIASDAKGIRGYMFVTSTGDYSHLGDFAKAASAVLH